MAALRELRMIAAMRDVTHERWREHARSGYNASVSNDLLGEIAAALEARVKAGVVPAPFTQVGAASWSVGTTLPELAAVAMAVVQPRLDFLVDLMERLPEAHMRFDVIGQGPPTKCADWCDACRMQRANDRATTAEEAIARVRVLHVKQDRPVKSWTLCEEHRRPPRDRAGRAEIEACAGCSYTDRWVCVHCNCPDDEWPCATIRALDGEADG